MVTGHSGKASPILPNCVEDEIQWSGRWGSLRRNDRVCKHRLCWVYHLTLIERHFKAAFALNRPSAATAVTTESSQIPQVVASTERSLEETLQCDYFRRVGFVCVFFLNLLSICVCFLDLHCICFLQLWQVNSFVILWKPLWEIGLWKRRGFVRLCIWCLPISALLIPHRWSRETLLQGVGQVWDQDSLLWYQLCQAHNVILSQCWFPSLLFLLPLKALI